jgi:hypothetical protein
LQDEFAKRGPRTASLYSCGPRRALQSFRDFIIGHLLEVTEYQYLPMLNGKLQKSRMKRVAQFPLIVLIVGVSKNLKRRQFRVDAGFLYLQFSKCNCSATAESPSLVAASVDRNTAEPWIKRPINVEVFQRIINLAEYNLKDIVRVGGRPRVPAHKTHQLMPVFVNQVFKRYLIAVLASADKCAILQT